MTSVEPRLFAAGGAIGNHGAEPLRNGANRVMSSRIVNNEDWYRGIDSIRFVSEIGRNFRMGTMLLKQSVQTRISSDVGMSFTEFAYQIFQAYDWLHLLKEYDCKFQVSTCVEEHIPVLLSLFSLSYGFLTYSLSVFGSLIVCIFSRLEVATKWETLVQDMN